MYNNNIYNIYKKIVWVFFVVVDRKTSWEIDIVLC